VIKGFDEKKNRSYAQKKKTYPTFKYQPMKQEKRICIKVLFRYLQSTTKTTLSLPNTQTYYVDLTHTLHN